MALREEEKAKFLTVIFIVILLKLSHGMVFRIFFLFPISRQRIFFRTGEKVRKNEKMKKSETSNEQAFRENKRIVASGPFYKLLKLYQPR